MFTNDFSKLFDPQQAAQMWQKMFTMPTTMPNVMQSSQQTMDTMKQVSTMWAETMSSCTEKQMQYYKSSMEDCVSAMRDLSSAKGMDEYMKKQAALTQQAAEKAQSTAQELAQQWQKTQTQCTDIMSKQLMQGMEWAKTTTGQSSSK
jgi:phasin family protein